MTVLTHARYPFERASHSKRDQPNAGNTYLAMIKRFSLIMLTAVLALSAAGTVITFKTMAYISHFTH